MNQPRIVSNAVLILALGFLNVSMNLASARAAAGELLTATLLSEDGSDRGTAYAEQPKIITMGDKTHVVWLDAGEEGFRVRGRTLDRTTGAWSPTVTIGEAHDNHGGPGLTVDSKGYLHVLYFPHNGDFRYRCSLRPNDLSAWGPESRFGERVSFPTLLCAPDDTLILSARRYPPKDEGPETARVEQQLWKKPAGEEWRKTSILMRTRYPDYAQFAVGMAWGPDGKTIHLNTRLYEGNPYKLDQPLNTIGYMVSHDLGDTWSKADGTPISLPATVDTIDVLAPDGGPTGPRYASAPLAVDAQGVPHLIYTVSYKESSRLYLATPAPGLGWTRRDLTPCLPEALRGWRVNLGMGGGVSVSESGRITIVTAVFNPPPEDQTTIKEWGHPTTEIVRLWSDDGLKTILGEVYEPTDEQVPRWHANIERATGHNRVPDYPGIIYTIGVKGRTLDQLELHNQIWWRPRK